MNPLEHQLHYPLGDAVPEPGRAIVIAPGIKWVRMGLPFALNHINLWLLADELDGRSGWTIIDCGLTNDATKAAWDEVFTHELEGRPVLRVFVTHMHPDHSGLAHWLCDRWQAPLWMSMTDYMVARTLSRGANAEEAAHYAAHFARHGVVDAEGLAKIEARSGTYFSTFVPRLPSTFRRVLGGDSVQIGTHTWSTIAGYGHAPEHLSLYCEALGIFIAGDMVLPRISTNVSVFDTEPEGNPLALFLRSLESFLVLPTDTLVLPSHGRPFKGLHERIAQLQVHHRERLDAVLQACDTPRAAAELLTVLFGRQFDLHELTFAMGEAVAHLNALWHEGKLERLMEADRIRFRRRSDHGGAQAAA